MPFPPRPNVVHTTYEGSLTPIATEPMCALIPLDSVTMDVQTTEAGPDFRSLGRRRVARSGCAPEGSIGLGERVRLSLPPLPTLRPTAPTPASTPATTPLAISQHPLSLSSCSSALLSSYPSSSASSPPLALHPAVAARSMRPGPGSGSGSRSLSRSRSRSRSRSLERDRSTGLAVLGEGEHSSASASASASASSAASRSRRSRAPSRSSSSMRHRASRRRRCSSVEPSSVRLGAAPTQVASDQALQVESRCAVCGGKRVSPRSSGLAGDECDDAGGARSGDDDDLTRRARRRDRQVCQCTARLREQRNRRRQAEVIASVAAERGMTVSAFSGQPTGPTPIQATREAPKLPARAMAALASVGALPASGGGVTTRLESLDDNVMACILAHLPPNDQDALALVSHSVCNKVLHVRAVDDIIARTSSLTFSSPSLPEPHP
ncbi:uncharacterized protein AMSG_00387 [Thecamonas trahens ATCC 50062]|uniref:F-box domain-containing protein n=1 Tax=Thecamonas trahens ATCC 50062 TaxID=461836 RepID=A0A0L0D8R3_THETB|nr:hypothetical protein AMSG_00387 [Thecamonas trahens ATCC 50062]KNC48610.1 hypothetical protein AMSG_00387 [Thecamonas trahens ATCC 50062]|eukprot:XP_013762666.1 hypothetical protein AMSG_00387 [Thecamonas trahens ATCC 50062]